MEEAQAGVCTACSKERGMAVSFSKGSGAEETLGGSISSKSQ
jgi:hypothetical protein